MPQINPHYLKLKGAYLFPEIAQRIARFERSHPGADLIKMGIGDVTEPLPDACREALIQAAHELGNADTFRGYGPSNGYVWLREAIVEHDYQSLGCDIDPSEIFVSDGSKCDNGNMLDILGPDNTVAVCDPVYPVYVDTNVMAGRVSGPADAAGRYPGLVYLPMTAENRFDPPLPSQPVDVIYLCSPNNPTGATASFDTLQRWVDYALRHDALIFFDAAYRSFITDTGTPRSIYQIPNARHCAIEFRSFSKNAGFTGTRCAFTVVPYELMGQQRSGPDISLHALWSRRQSTKFNGVSYPVQRAAEAVYSEAGQQQTRALVDLYMNNARLIREGLQTVGLEVYGGINAPYVWVKTPDGLGSWDYFEKLLHDTKIVCTPGSGFGATGEGYVRMSAFNHIDRVAEAIDRVQKATAVKP